MAIKASMILLIFACWAPRVLGAGFDSDLREATLKNDWPELILLLTPRKGQNIEHDFLLARAYLQMERRADAMKLLSGIHAVRRDDRSLKLLQAAGEIFFSQETSQLHSEGVRLVSLLKFPEALEKFEQAISREPGNTLVLVRLVQVELLLGKLESANAHLKELLLTAPYLQEARFFALRLQSQAPESMSDVVRFPNGGKRPEAEVPLVFQLEQWKRLGRTDEIRSAAKEILARHPGWSHAQGWLLRSGMMGAADSARLKILLERNLRQKDRFENEREREMKRTRYFWVGYSSYEELAALLK
jgi:tetratricopeptide (TPR) repeat protein